MTFRVLIVSGYSNAGKTTFTRWLARHGDLDLLDVDACGDDRQRLSLSELAARTKPLVVDWPYNPEARWLGVVEALQSAGVTLWWFDADPAAARRSCAQRPEAAWHLRNFDHHTQIVEAQRDSVRQLYGPRRLLTLDAEGRRPSCGEILRAIREVDALPWLPAVSASEADPAR